MRRRAALLAALVALVVGAAASGVRAATPSFDVATSVAYEPLRAYGNSTLYGVNATTMYDALPYLLVLDGDRYSMGYAYGSLLSQEIQEMYATFVNSLLPPKFLDRVLFALVEAALDQQWDDHLSVQLPVEFQKELQGIADGATSKGAPQVYRLITRVVLLANAPGDLQDFLYIIIGELNITTPLPPKDRTRDYRLMCSMISAWGSRTQGGDLYAARNLDWQKDTGINQFKLVTVHKPNDGAYAHATFGFVGLWGALAGMSSRGITVHEANLEEDQITLDGFPWILRLRYIMENAETLAEAHTLWADTNNTVGFNHMVGSASDTQALAMETMEGYTAYFLSDDERERQATYTDLKTGQVSQIGFPLGEALWRTNHGYDPVIRAHYLWSQAPDSWSMERYMFIHDALVQYESVEQRMGTLEMINVTAIAGDKGKEPYVCQDSTVGSNILSVMFEPKNGVAYSAWERGRAATWRPAACSTYIKFDLTQFWGSQVIRPRSFTAPIIQQ